VNRKKNLKKFVPSLSTSKFFRKFASLASVYCTVGNVGTKIQSGHSTSNSSKLRTRSDSNETYIKRSPLKKQFQKRWSHCGEMRRKHANFCEYKYVGI